ncbi:Kelch repeat and BTB domain-containing protein 8 [Tupaia chinensis]|uniref:Kelch repeat and BTB domain-containing protein 8 n=1 Tax=Tupaia chinensis TaxID=246437 RepID=L9J9S1_TUPCH|nr:Kelch repeat and BTB domain-containing protein 8 [Tupaia chinensis]
MNGVEDGGRSGWTVMGGWVPAAPRSVRQAVEGAPAATIHRPSLVSSCSPLSAGRCRLPAESPATPRLRCSHVPSASMGHRARRAPGGAGWPWNLFSALSSPDPILEVSGGGVCVCVCMCVCVCVCVYRCIFVGGKKPSKQKPPRRRNWLRTPCGCTIFLLLDLSKSSPTPNGIPSSETANDAMDPFHACSILKQLKTMYDEGQLTDIVVEVDHGKTFSCHRNVLAAISPYFRIQGLAAVYKDSIYYIAGTCGNHQRMFTVEAYDIELNKWTRKKDFPCDQSINPYLKLVLFQNKLHLFVRATQVTVEEHVFRTSRKNSLYQYDDIADQWMKVYETPDRLWDLGRHFECAVAKLYPQCLQKVL